MSNNVISLADYKAKQQKESSVSKQHRLLSVLKNHTKEFSYGDQVTWTNYGIPMVGYIVDVDRGMALVRSECGSQKQIIEAHKLTLGV